MSKSELMRQMYDSGINVSEISKKMNCHYSYVYGVIQRHCNKTSQEIRHNSTTSKSDEIRRLFDENLTVGQIAKQLNSNYSFVFSVVKKYKESKQK